MRRPGLHLIILAGLLFLAGCGGEQASAPLAVAPAEAPTSAAQPTADLLPLAVGNWWRYREYAFTGQGVAASQAEAPGVEARAVSTGVSRLRIVKWLRLDGVVWWQGNRTWVGQTYVSQELFRHNANGLLRMWGMPPKFYALQTPLAVGHTWQNEADGATMRIAALRGQVTVPYGTLTGCVVVDQVSNSDPTFRSRYYYKSGLGLVREIFFNGDTVVSRVDLWQTNVGVAN